jgi:hypothetical protein
MSTYRIPPSLAWLVRTRQMTAGRIRLAERDLNMMLSEVLHARQIIEKHEQLPKLIALLKADLETTDRMIRMHSISVDPEKIGPLRIQNVRKKQPYGATTRAIYNCLATEPLKWKTTTEVAMFVAMECFPEITNEEFPKYRWDVRHRMRAMAQQGKIDRSQDKRVHSTDEALWRQKTAARGNKLQLQITGSEVQISFDSLDSNLETSVSDQLD